MPKSRLVSRADWKSDPAEITAGILRHFAPPLIVRSSAPAEDQVNASHAGRYLSVGGVRTASELAAAIDSVFGSYDQEAGADLLFVQTMLEGADCVGVAFTHDPETGSPYLIVNYSETDQTDTITSGRGSYSTWIALEQGVDCPPIECLRPLPAVLAEIQALSGLRNLDVEFAVSAGRVYVFQARELVTETEAAPGAEALVALTTEAVADLRRLQRPARGLVGRRTVFGVMPDWNPAEIIGIRPRPLAVSLYRALVTDRVWSKRRGDYGYRPVSDVPLLHELLGVPYVDVRASFNSLTPAALPEDIASDFIDAALWRLGEQRHLHDKVEFSVLPTCYTADLREVLAERFGSRLSAMRLAQVGDAIRALTCRLVENAEAFDRVESSQLSQLDARRQQHRDMPALQRISALLSDAADLGVTPFVGQARKAFIAIDIMMSMVRTGAMTQARFAALLSSIDTVARRFQRDRSRLGRADLLRLYGHLRPGTYDITAPRYDQMPDGYLSTSASAQVADQEPFDLHRDEARAMERYLADLGAALDPEAFVAFVKRAVAGREEAKFEFTKNISDALELMAQQCEQHGWTRQDASFLRLGDILAFERSPDEMARSLADGRATYERQSVTKTPMVIVSPEELWSFNHIEGQPNYIGAATLTAPPLIWPTARAFDGAILFIENADPGFDWIFGTNMAGFVTMFGGPNSHMAIRAHELGVTAIIGAGPPLFARLSGARLLRIDPKVKKAEVFL